MKLQWHYSLGLKFTGKISNVNVTVNYQVFCGNYVNLPLIKYLSCVSTSDIMYVYCNAKCHSDHSEGRHRQTKVRIPGI